MLKVKRRGERGGRQALRRDQRLRVQKLENKEGINETHQHDRTIMADVKVSKIPEISDFIVFNLLSGHVGVSPRSHYQPYCAISGAHLFFSSIFSFSFTDLGHKVKHRPWQNDITMQT